MPRADDDGQRRKPPSRCSHRRKGPAIPTLEVNNPFGLSLRVHFPDDLVTEILVRLPAKSVTRFKSVCKKWLSIISSDHFCHQHALRCPKPQPSLILFLGLGEYFYFNPTNDQKKKKTKTKTKTKKMTIPYNNSWSKLGPGCMLQQACNGLMLLRFWDFKYPEMVTIHNLTTKQSRKIFLTHNHNYPYVHGLILAFDPSKSPYYKIVCIRCSVYYNDDDEQECRHQIEVYDSESHTWKLSLDAFTTPNAYLNSDGTYWNNGIYWETYDPDHSYCWFDIGENVIKTLSSPSTLIFNRTPRLQASNGRLYSYLVESGKVTVWELGVDDDHRPQWLFRYHSRLLRHCTSNNILRLIGRSDEDEDETCKLLIHKAGKILSYNFVDETYKHPLDLRIQPCYQPKKWPFPITCFHFAQTLALV